MSGYCLECGNDLCICSELEEEAKKQPDVVFICQRKEIEKLQEQNKILREALEFYADENNWELGKVHSFVEVCEQDHEWIDSFPPFRVTQLTGGKLAREALAKIDKQGE